MTCFLFSHEIEIRTSHSPRGPPLDSWEWCKGRNSQMSFGERNRVEAELPPTFFEVFPRQSNVASRL